jgi:hypothetical protein
LSGISLGLSESEISYCNGKKIGKYGFFFENIEFNVPVENTHNKVSLKITLPNAHQISLLLKGKLNKWDYVYESNP